MQFAGFIIRSCCEGKRCIVAMEGQEVKMLIVTLHEGDYVMIGDSVRVHFDHKRGRDSLALGIEAPKDLMVLRGKLYEEGVAEKAAKGDLEAKLLSQRLQSEHKERRRRSYIRQGRRQKQERRMAAGEIKPYNEEVPAI